MAVKGHQLKHMRSSDTKVLTEILRLYILMTTVQITTALQLLLVGFRMTSIQIKSEQCWGNRYVIRTDKRVMSKEFDSFIFYAWEKLLKPYRITVMLFSTESALLLTMVKH